MRETELIGVIRNFADRTPAAKSLIRGIGDDCAVVRPARNQDLVFTTDLTLEDRHFTLATHSAADIGHKALARSLSDLAAMGADPVFCLVSLALPPSLGRTWIKRFYRGLTALAREHRITLAGGDLASSDKIAIDVMCCGSVPQSTALLRSGAKPGDGIYVSGELGGSALALEQKRGAGWKRHKRPEPRLALGRAIRGLASAAMDLSDGLSLDLERLCRESHVGARLISDIPRAKGASIEQALHGGEDYELLFTAGTRKNIPARLAGVPIARIGETTNEAWTITYGGRILEPLGFDHFRS
jgi:thiamine-monophosphate kinase